MQFKMTMKIDPQKYGLNSRTQLVQISDTEIAINVDRKSRFIMKDGIGFLKKVDTIKEHYPDLTVSLIISTAMCSKTVKFLSEQGISIYQH